MKAAFFYDCVTKEFCINATCGCMDSSYAIKPNATDVRLLKEKLAENKVIFNRKTNKVLFYYDNVRKR